MKFCISAVFFVVVEDCDWFLDDNQHNLYIRPKTPQLTCVSHDRIKKNHSRLCNVIQCIFSLQHCPFSKSIHPSSSFPRRFCTDVIWPVRWITNRHTLSGTSCHWAFLRYSFVFQSWHFLIFSDVVTRISFFEMVFTAFVYKKK